MNEATCAAIQMVSGDDLKANLATTGALLAEARAAGATLAVLPENFAFLGRHERDKLAVAEADGRGPIQDFVAECAAREGLWIVAGTLPLRGDDPDRARAACTVVDDAGRRRARYDKLHMFDVEVSDTEAYRESATLEPGDTPVVVSTPLGPLGLAVCYDLRFPGLFRRLGEAGAIGFAVPSAFTAVTGAAHWDLLTRARAVDNLAFVIGAAQGGEHPGRYRTHGRSRIVEPWGTVLAEQVESGPGVTVANIDLAALAERRRRFPVLRHCRTLGAAQLEE